MDAERDPHVFDLHLHVKVQTLGPLGMTFDSHTTAINSSLAILSDPLQQLNCGQALSFSVTFPAGTAGEVVILRCRGKVLALDHSESTASVSIDWYEFLRAGNTKTRVRRTASKP
jgi:hypothetical protein